MRLSNTFFFFFFFGRGGGGGGLRGGVLPQQLLCNFTRVRFCSSMSKKGLQRAIIFVTFRFFFRMKWTNAKPKFVICANETHSFLNNVLDLINVSLVIADLVLSEYMASLTDFWMELNFVNKMLSMVWSVRFVDWYTLVRPKDNYAIECLVTDMT